MAKRWSLVPALRPPHRGDSGIRPDQCRLPPSRPGPLGGGGRADAGGAGGRSPQGDWTSAAVDASNLSELALTLGYVPRAVAFGEQSVELADPSGASVRTSPVPPLTSQRP